MLEEQFIVEPMFEQAHALAVKNAPVGFSDAYLLGEQPEYVGGQSMDGLRIDFHEQLLPSRKSQ